MTPSGATLILTSVATSCVAILLAMPKPVEPVELPALVVPRAATDTAREADRSLAAALPTGAAVTRVRRLLDETARGETRREAFGSASRRRTQMDAAVGVLLHEKGASALRAIRARATLDALSALEHELPERVRRLGRFMESLTQYGAYRDGTRLAPWPVVRVMFFARVNAMLGRLPTDGMTTDDQRMYWGWLALHATSAPIDLRMRALTHYGDLGGKNAAEAAGVMLYRLGEIREASRAFEILHAQNGSLRARNHALAGLAP
jgi:hypothetical protein